MPVDVPRWLASAATTTRVQKGFRHQIFSAERPLKPTYDLGMARPFPVHPRGPRRRRHPTATTLLACPRVCPQWELSTVAALMKPKPLTRSAVEHRDGQQHWPAGATESAQSVLSQLQHHLGQPLPIHFDADGEYHLLAKLSTPTTESVDEARAVAIALSRAVPQCWFVVGRLFVRNGRFYRRRFGYRLELVHASNVHLSRPMRQLVRSLAEKQGVQPSHDSSSDDS